MDDIVVKQIVIDIACHESVDAAEEVQIALSRSSVFTKDDYLHGGCYIASSPACNAVWTPSEYESATGVDVRYID